MKDDTNINIQVGEIETEDTSEVTIIGQQNNIHSNLSRLKQSFLNRAKQLEKQNPNGYGENGPEFYYRKIIDTIDSTDSYVWWEYFKYLYFVSEKNCMSKGIYTASVKDNLLARYISSYCQPRDFISVYTDSWEFQNAITYGTVQQRNQYYEYLDELVRNCQKMYEKRFDLLSSNHYDCIVGNWIHDIYESKKVLNIFTIGDNLFYEDEVGIYRVAFSNCWLLAGQRITHGLFNWKYKQFRGKDAIKQFVTEEFSYNNIYIAKLFNSNKTILQVIEQSGIKLYSRCKPQNTRKDDFTWYASQYL